MTLRESSPLLPSRDPGSVGARDRQQTSPRPTLIVILVLLYLVLLDLGYELIMPAQTRVIEQIYCKEYYALHGVWHVDHGKPLEIDEKLCKVPQVQGEVAILRGWQATLDSIGMLLFSVPWSYVATARGRKPVILLLSAGLFSKYIYVQFILFFGGTIDLKWTWLSALHTMLGGSVSVGTVLIYTIISDVVPTHDRVIVFFQVMAATIATQFFGGLASAALMSQTAWLPMGVGLGIEVAAIMTLFFIPETLNYNHDPSRVHAQEPDLRSPSPIHGRAGLHFPWLRAQIRDATRRVRTCVAILTSDHRVLLIVSTFLVHMLFLNQGILRQYISARYDISLAQATMIISVRSGMIFVLCVFVLPVMNVRFRKQYGSTRSDLILARASALLLGIGLLAVGLSPNLMALVAAVAVGALGGGLFSFIRSLSISLVRSEDAAIINGLIGVLDTIGFMIGSPVLAACFKEGMALGTWMQGLPFFTCAGATVIMISALGMVHVKNDELKEDEARDTEANPVS